jgi:hypothetical protein
MKLRIFFIIAIFIIVQCGKNKNAAEYCVKILRNANNDTSLVNFQFLDCDSILPEVRAFNNTAGIKLDMNISCHNPFCPPIVGGRFYTEELGLFGDFNCKLNSATSCKCSTTIYRVDLLSIHSKRFKIVMGPVFILEGFNSSKRKINSISDTLLFELKGN